MQKVKTMYRGCYRSSIELKMSTETYEIQCMTTAKLPIVCKLAIFFKIIEQMVKFKYLGVKYQYK